MMGYNFEVAYRKWVLNTVADALSRKPDVEGKMAISTLSTDLLEKVKSTWEVDADLARVIGELEEQANSHPKFTWPGNQLRRKGKLVVGNNGELRKEILWHFHNSSLGGHSGMAATMSRVTNVFFWKGLKNEVQNWVRECLVCQQYKVDNSAYPGLL